MAAVLRVKRKRTDDPTSALVLAYKRSRPTGYDNTDPSFINYQDKKEETPAGENSGCLQKEIFQLYTSTDASETGCKMGMRKILSVIRSNCKESMNPIHFANLRGFWSKEKSEAGNFVDELRSVDVEELELMDQEEQATPAKQTLSELNDAFEAFNAPEFQSPKREKVMGHSGIECNGVEMIRLKKDFADFENPSEYVYDFYYSSGISESEFRRLEHWLGVEPYHSENELVVEENASEADSNIYEDEDDSNDENNWRNDYPEDDEWDGSNKGGEWDDGRLSGSDEEDPDEGTLHSTEQCYEEVSLDLVQGLRCINMKEAAEVSDADDYSD